MAADLLGATLGHYRIDAVLGRGGMGEVYRAHDHSLRRPVAIKVLPAEVAGSEDSLARFLQEARSASALNHPNVVSIYQIGREVPVRAGAADPGAVNYIAMELVVGETLRTAIERQRPDLKRTLDLLAQAADALAAAHAAGIVHRDFKPDNLMLADGGYVKVLDFGLAKPRAELLADTETQRTALGTAPGVVLGTVGYMSPEQAEGRRTDHRTDIFSFGCVLYEAATGVRAFRGTSSIDTLHRIINADPEPIAAHVPAAPGELQRIIRKCLAKDPDARYQSMKDVANDVRALRRELDSTLSAAKVIVGAAGPAVAARSRRAAAMTALALVAAAAVGGTIWYVASGARAPAAPAIDSRRDLQVERLTGSGSAIDAVISPDGKYVAYVNSQGGSQSLWVRQLSSPQPLQVLAPDRVGFWGIQFSPDSTSLYYAIKRAGVGEGQLLTVPLLGGTPKSILNGIDSTISWSPDGASFTFLRANHPEPGASAVMVAAADGRDARALIVKRVPYFFTSFFAAASWSPDGRHISASVRDRDARVSYLITVDVASGAEQAFPARFRQMGHTAWLPDGSGIAFTAPFGDQFLAQGGGQIYVQPYPSGEPWRVTSDLLEYRNATFSRDGSTLVTIGADTAPTLWRVPLDGSDAVRIRSERYDGLGGLSTTAGGRLVFTAQGGGGNQLAIADPDGGNRRLLATEGAVGWPLATADGRLVGLMRRGDNVGIWMMNEDGGNPRLILPISDATYLALSPDGRTLLFTSSRSGETGTWSVPIDGGEPTLVTAEIDRGAYLPDGRSIAGVSRFNGNLDLAVMRLSDLHIERFAAQPLTSSGGIVQWMPDGSGVLYTTAERTNLWLQRLSGGAPVRVTRFEDSSITLFRGTPITDGKTMLVARGPQTRDAFVIRQFR